IDDCRSGRRIERFGPLRRFDFNGSHAGDPDRRLEYVSEHAQSFGSTLKPFLNLLSHPRLNLEKVMKNFGDAPFAFGGATSELLVVQCCDGMQKTFVQRVHSFDYLLHSSTAYGRFSRKSST